ncbi:MAG: DUF1580 domain-containing protein [Planctomycetaceae bacterium]
MPTASAIRTELLIDLEHDDLRPVTVIAKERTGRRPSPGTVWRWRLKGCRGAKLESVLVNGCWCTTVAAFARFVRDQTDAANAACTAADISTERDEATTRRLKAAGLI